MKKRSIVLLIIFIFLIFISIFYGGYPLHFPLSNEEKNILFYTRMPRVCSAILIGAMLGSGSTVLRHYMKNPLADPGLLGISSGGQLGMLLTLLLFPFASNLLLQIGATLGSSLLLVTLFLFFKRDIQQKMMILFGISISAMISSLVTIIATIKHYQMFLTSWTQGGLQMVVWSQTFLVFIAFIIGVIILKYFLEPLQIYVISSDLASTIGGSLSRLNLQIFLFLALYIGVSTSVAGNLMFFGLLVSVLSKQWGDLKKQVLISFALGSTLMLGADFISRIWNWPEESSLFPIIIVLGAPFYFFLIRKGEG